MGTPIEYATFSDIPYNTQIDVSAWRCGPYIREHFLSVDAVQVAMCFYLGAPLKKDTKGELLHVGRLGTNLKVPVFSMLKYVIEKRKKPFIKLTLTKATVSEPANKSNAQKFDTNILNYMSLFENSAITQFIFFYETYIDFVKTLAAHDITKYEKRWGFARVIRNALTHGGTINIRDQSLKKVSWCGVDYDHTNFGEIIMGNKLSSPDLICLMLDLDLALSSLGHP